MNAQHTTLESSMSEAKAAQTLGRAYIYVCAQPAFTIAEYQDLLAAQNILKKLYEEARARCGGFVPRAWSKF